MLEPKVPQPLDAAFRRVLASLQFQTFADSNDRGNVGTWRKGKDGQAFEDWIGRYRTSLGVSFSCEYYGDRWD